MIATIGPLVQEAPIQWRRSAALHTVGSVVGGSAVFGGLAVAGWLGLAGLPLSARWMAAGALAFVLALHEFGWVRLPLPKTYHSVPQSWWRDFGPNKGAFAYGLVLGIGLTTVVPFGTFYAAAGWALLVANPAYGLALGTAYGLARALPVLLAGRALAAHSQRTPPHTVLAAIAEWVDRKRRLAHTVNGLVEAAFAGAAMAGVVLARWP